MKTTIKLLTIVAVVALCGHSKSYASAIAAQPCLKPVPHAHHKAAPVDSPACIAPQIVLPCPSPDEPLDYIPEVPNWYHYPVPTEIVEKPGFWSRIWTGATVGEGGPISAPRLMNAPEIDPSSAPSALTLLAGTLWLVVRKGKRL